jgi:hypothetical protein
MPFAATDHDARRRYRDLADRIREQPVRPEHQHRAAHDHSGREE